MSNDPAVEAAQRAWVKRYGAEQLPRFYEYCNEDEDVAAFVTDAAREALAPIREKNIPTALRGVAAALSRLVMDTTQDQELTDDVVAMIRRMADEVEQLIDTSVEELEQ